MGLIIIGGFVGANLNQANLKGANFRGASLSQTNLEGTTAANLDIGAT